MLFRRNRFARVALCLSLAGALTACWGVSAHAETRLSNLWWSPEAVTEGGHRIDELLMFIFNLTVVVFVLVQGVYTYFLIKYRRRAGVRAIYSHGNNRLEFIWTLIPTVVFIALAAYSNHLWKELRLERPKDMLPIDIVAHQFGWYIRNPGADGKLGAFDQKSLTTTNTFGTIPGDPSGDDDYQSTELTLPVGRTVNIYLRSQDVIHSFFVPEFRMYQDAVPGMLIDTVWFTPDKTGHFELACSQLCGSGHYSMKTGINVVTSAEYTRIAREKSKDALEKKAAADAASHTVSAR